MAVGGALQVRVDSILREDAGEPRSGFSAYLDSAKDLVDAFWAAASSGDDPEAAIARALDLAEAATARHSRARIRHAVEVLVTNHPRAHNLGLRVPTLEERTPHLTLPTRRDQ